MFATLDWTLNKRWNEAKRRGLFGAVSLRRELSAIDVIPVSTWTIYKESPQRSSETWIFQIILYNLAVASLETSASRTRWQIEVFFTASFPEVLLYYAHCQYTMSSCHLSGNM